MATAGVPAFELLRSAVRRSKPSPAVPDTTVRHARGVDWSVVLWLGRQHRSLLHLVSALEHEEDAVVPRDVSVGLKAYRYSEAVQRLTKGRELYAIQQVFDAGGVQAMSLSGWALGEMHYDVAGLRVTGSVTRFLIRPGDRQRAEACLSSLGYAVGAPDHLQLQTAQRSRVVLDEALGGWERARHLTIGGVRIAVPSTEDWLAAISGHFASRERGATLQQALDVVSLIHRGGEMDWDVFLAESSRVGRRLRAVAGVAASCDLLGWPRPPLIETECRLDRRVERAAQLMKASCASLGLSNSARSVRQPKPVDLGELGSLGRYCATPSVVVDRMLEAVAVGSGDVVYDLGSGDGRIVLRAAQAFGARGVGIDRDPVRIAEASAAASAAGLTELVSFIQGEILETALGDATVVCVYLQGFAYERIGRWLRETLRPGTRVVSHHIGFPGWIPAKTEIVSLGGGRTTFVYVWVVV